MKVRTDAGVSGLGETLHYQSKYVIDHILKPAVIGEDPLAIARHRSRGLVGKDLYGAPGRAWETDPWAYSGFEMALFDISGKVAGLPLYALLGGLYRRQIPFVEYVYPLADRLTPEKIAEDCAARIVSAHAHTLELKVGVLEPEQDVETVKRIREAVGSNVDIRIDSNSSWSVETAIRTLSAMDGCALANAEEPCRGLAAMALVRRRIRTPISTHCADAPVVAALGAADNIVLDLPSEGGIVSAMEVAHIADALGLGFWVRSTGELGIGTAAILHLAAATPCMRHANQTVLPLLVDDVIKAPFFIREGFATVPDRPGLGVDLDEERVDKYARLHAEEGTYWFWGGRSQSQSASSKAY